MKLYGTTTSPFVRRVRIVAAELDLPVVRHDTATEAGQAELLALSPIGKVPVAEVDGRVLFDSRVIIEWLTQTRGYGTMRAPRDRWQETNLINAIDAALEAAISLYYLRRDGVAIADTVYETRQRARMDRVFGWLAGQLHGPSFCAVHAGLGLAEIALLSTLDWLDFRDMYPTRELAAFAPMRKAFAPRASLATTLPST